MHPEVLSLDTYAPHMRLKRGDAGLKSWELDRGYSDLDYAILY